MNAFYFFARFSEKMNEIDALLLVMESPWHLHKPLHKKKGRPILPSNTGVRTGPDDPVAAGPII